MKVTIILPTRNEESAIGKVLEEIEETKASLPPDINLEVLLADYKSIDQTIPIAQQHKAKILRIPQQGKGYAVRKAIKSAHKSKYLIMADADYTYPLDTIPTILSWLIFHKADIVVGYRKYREKGAMPKLNVFGNIFLSALASLLYGRRIHDVCSGLWGFNAHALRKFDLTSQGFTLEADLLINTLKTKSKFVQFPIVYRCRAGHSSAKFRPVIDWLKIVWFVIKRRVK